MELVWICRARGLAGTTSSKRADGVNGHQTKLLPINQLQAGASGTHCTFAVASVGGFFLEVGGAPLDMLVIGSVGSVHR
jgi:hypothetical protein